MFNGLVRAKTLAPQRAPVEAIDDVLHLAAWLIQRVTPIATLQLQNTLLEHYRLGSDVQNITLDHRKSPLQRAHVAFMG
ncbi:hypothetical protein D3C84_757680 [compost metagenome]